MISDNPYAAEIDSVYETAHEDATPENIRNIESRVHVKQCLGYDLTEENMTYLAKMKEEALKQREILYAKVESGEISPSDFAEQVNEAHNDILDNIATKISPQEFEKLFGFSSDNKIQLIDPESAENLFDISHLMQK
ncbi:MAG: hypothetical protein HAW67_06665 [Endozoicomonadaceae bacterium]|nr:hypothetical protein [Endozoicomonadaceae bacterium]